MTSQCNDKLQVVMKLLSCVRIPLVDGGSNACRSQEAQRMKEDRRRSSAAARSKLEGMMERWS